MKIFMKILVCVTFISMLFSMLSFESTCRMLEEDVLRLHILSNSDSSEDQQLKLEVRDAVLQKTSHLFNDVKTKADAARVIESNLEYIEKIATQTIFANGFDYPVKAQLKNEFFDTRYYDDFTMPAGVYETLLITIGDGQGKNWWCVMYPTLCVGASSPTSMKDKLNDDEYDVVASDRYQFRFKFLEYFRKIYMYFN